jgi:hypothetical protein
MAYFRDPMTAFQVSGSNELSLVIMSSMFCNKRESSNSLTKRGGKKNI